MNETLATPWDIMLARRDIARHGGKYPVLFAEWRMVELGKKPWSQLNKNDWSGRVKAYELIAKGSISHVEIQRD